MTMVNQVFMHTSDTVNFPATLLPVCPLCGSDDAEPEGVAGCFDGSKHASLILRCGGCTAVYLNPDPTGFEIGPPVLPRRALTRRRVRAWTRGLPSDARLLGVDCAGGHHLRALACEPGWIVEGTERDAKAATQANAAGFSVSHGTVEDLQIQHGGYHLVLLPHSLEATKAPEALLTAVQSLLLQSGRVIVIVNNLESPSFRLFGGRHWDGYQFPRTRQYFNAATLRQLSNKARLEVKSIKTMLAPGIWLVSMRNLLCDWQVSGGLTSLLSGTYGLPTVAASAIEGFSWMLCRGSLLVATLEKR